MSFISAVKKFGAELRSPDITTLELRSDPLNNPAVPLSTAGFLSWAMSGEPTAAGEQVTIHTALQQTTVYACVRVISESIASLPCKVYERRSGGRFIADDHPLAYMLGVEPNPEMTAVTFWDSIVGALALTGNAYVEIQRDNGGRPVALWPLHPQATEPKRNSNGDIVDETTDGMEPGQMRVLKASDVLHIPLFSFDGLKGISPIHLARQGVGLARAAEKFGARFFGNGAKPGGVLSTTSDLDDIALKAAKESWERTNGGENQGRTAMLPGDWKYTPIGISPEDSQFLQTRQFQRLEIAAIFRVPPHMVGDMSKQSTATAEQAGLSLVIDTLRPYISRIEAEIIRKLFPQVGRNSGKYFVEFDTSSRLRGDLKSTLDAVAVGRQWGVLSTNDSRLMLGLNPVVAPEANLLWAPVNMQDAARLLNTESIQDQPVDANPALPSPDQRSMLNRYSTAYIAVYRDAFGRLLKRKQRDYETILTLFTPVLRSIADAALEHAAAKHGLTNVTADASLSQKNIDLVCRSMEKRAKGFHESEIDALCQSEFLKAIRSLHINTARDCAAAVAEASITPEPNDGTTE
jgi:HK97 family phage portal protein